MKEKYRVMKPFMIVYSFDHPEGIPSIDPPTFIEFDSKEQFEEMSKHSQAYHELLVRNRFLEDTLQRMMSISETAKHEMQQRGRF